MKSSTVGALAWAVFAAAALPSQSAGQGLPPPLELFLQQTIGLDQTDLSASTSGKAVVKVLAQTEDRELAVFGIVRIDVPRTFYVQRATDFPSSLRTPTRIRFALFSDPVAQSDVAALAIRHDDLDDLARCRPGSCKVKLSSEAMAQLRTRMDPDSPSADSVASVFFRERMIQFITDYRANGNRALVVYADKETTPAAQVFGAMLARSPYLYQYAPSLERYLANYPGDRPVNISEALFWAEDDLPGLKTTITITHQVVYAPPELPGCTLIASKMLYADHYLDGALTVTAVVDQAGDQAVAPGIYLVLLRRLHFDNLPSGGLMNVRGRAMGKLREQAATVLRDAKTRSEQAYRSSLTEP